MIISLTDPTHSLILSSLLTFLILDVNILSLQVALCSGLDPRR